ncbi:hypothetical protein [Polynucleobacter brandtiae]|uniref:Uncharacterized protein n=1 Tax=Polynucleobacter brandtiae TaxID=1938816 RepID=A0A2M8VH98_9BURK|nr:hypothetical protein [Polynucleobacter brandtiae]PJI76062.1 hypothetical protein B0G85_2051 [Polynucleobacter brandtiae]
MYSIIKFVLFLFHSGWKILNPNLNPLRNAPLQVKYFATVLLGCFWSLAFCLYTAQFFFIGINMLAHIVLISMIFVTWYTFTYFRKKYPSRNLPPLMRDRYFAPKCYEMTEAEKSFAIKRADLLLKAALI